MIVHFLYEPADAGLDRVAILLANEMARRGLPVELWMVKPGGATAALIDHHHVHIRLIPTVPFGKRGMRLFFAIPALAKMIRKQRPDFILSAGNQSNLVIALANKLVQKPSTAIVQKITNPIKRPGMAKIAAAIRRKRFEITARLGDMCLVLSQTDAKTYKSFLSKASSKFQAVRNAYVTTEMLAMGDRRVRREGAAPVRLLAVGRLAKQKNYPMMLHALARLSEIDWNLTILGTGPLHDETKVLAARLEIADRVNFAGFVQNPSLHYAQSDMLLLSSRWEGFPAVPLEALASGCDIVASDCAGGLSDILHDLGCKPVPIDDDKAFAKAILDKVSNPSDITKMTEIARKYTITASVDDHLRLMEKIKPVELDS